MLFEKMADFILKHSKAIVIVWVIILLVSIYPALQASTVMKYDLNSMADSNSESMQGLLLIDSDFVSASVVPNTADIQILAMPYSSEEGKANAQGFIKYMQEKFPTEYPKLRAIMDASLFIETDDGAVFAAMVYDTDDAVAIMNDTANLRGFISSCKSTYEHNSGFETYLTGTPAISYDMEHNALEDISKIDPFTVLLILVLVGLFFRSFITSITPPVTIGVAFAVTACLIYFIGQAVNIFYITEMMILVSMMGAGCDYCIFIIARYREELRSGKDHHNALREAIIWAGESITISGCSVMIGFGAMMICSYSLVKSMGLCLALGILLALIAALTLIPSILNLTGEKIFWPTTIDSFKKGGKATKGWYAWFGKLGDRYFHWSAKISIKHAVPIVIIAVIVTAPAAYYALTNETSYDMIGAMQSGESGKGMDVLGECANLGVMLPDYAIIEYDHSIATITYTDFTGSKTGQLVWSDDFLNKEYPKLQKLEDDIIASDPTNIASTVNVFIWSKFVEAEREAGKTDSEIIADARAQSLYLDQVIAGIKAMTYLMTDSYIVKNMGPTIDYQMNAVIMRTVGGEFARSEMNIGLDYTADLVKLQVTTQESAMSPRSMETIDKLKGVVDTFDKENEEVTQKWITGGAVVMNDISHVFSSEFKVIEVVVVLLIVILLFLVMKSYTIPFRSVFTILMSIAWTLALTYYVFVVLLHGELIWLVPMMLLVICLGLGMDYDILLTTRIKENVIRGMSNDDAIYQAVTTTGSVITICGLIMGGAFGTLMLSGMEMMKEFGFALCFAILADALIVRTYIVPAMMHLLGKWNWVGPKFMQSKKTKVE